MKIKPIYDAQTFVLENGNLLDKLRLSVSSFKIPADSKQELQTFLRRIINSDGGVPFDVKPGVPSSVKTTAEVLMLLVDSDWEVTDLYDGMIRFLVERQKNDGGFAETLKLDPFIEDKFGTSEGREWYPVGKSITWLTGKALEALCKVGYENKERITRARDFLLQLQYEDGHWPDFAGHPESDPLGTGNILPALRAAGVPENHKAYVSGRAALFQHLKSSIENGFTYDMVDLIAVCPPQNKKEKDIIRKGIELIFQTQRSDGGWCVAGSQKSNPDLTAQLLLAISRCNQFLDE